MAAMPRPPLPYLEKVPSNGKVYWYVRPYVSTAPSADALAG